MRLIRSSFVLPLLLIVGFAAGQLSRVDVAAQPSAATKVTTSVRHWPSKATPPVGTAIRR